MLDLEFVQASDCGRVRDHNEDYLGHAGPGRNGWLFALADGVGGQNQGEVASRIAVETLIDGFQGAPGSDPHLVLLPRLVRDANTRVLDSGDGMATTLVSCALRYDRAVVCHVGDSRCYLIRQGHAKLLTHDHTVANEQLGLGLITRSEAAVAATRGVLTRSLGNGLFVNVETREHQILPDDILLLCSDGLHNAIPDSEMAEIAASHSDPSESVQRLLNIANSRDGSDNVSVQLIRIRSVERIGMYRGRPYRLP